MEAAANEQRWCGRKRTRDDEEETAADDTQIILQPKKQELHSSSINSSYNDNGNDNDDERVGFHDGIGVFDFPWLKHGGDDQQAGVMIFDSEPSTFQDLDNYNFTHPACECEEKHVTGFCDEATTYSSQNHHGDGSAKNDDESLWSSLAVDDLEPVDCIWSSVMDHPLHIDINGGFNKRNL